MNGKPLISGLFKTWLVILLSVFSATCPTSISARAPIPVEGFEMAPPRIIRTCCSFGAELSVAGIPFVRQTDITSLENIGRHEYLGGREEGNGNIYTRRGGFIDLGHLRDCADWTAYLYNKIISSSKKGEMVEIDLGSEGGSKTLLLKIPVDLKEEDAYELAGKIAYDLSLWHEIATWFGASYIPFVPERYSSFSPEDLYSNLLGTKLGIQALRSNLDYNEAMTQLISLALDSLQAVKTSAETLAAMEEVEDVWWTRKKSLPSKKVLLKRYVDTEAFLLPWLVPGEFYPLPPFALEKPDSRLSECYEIKIKLNYRFPLREICDDPSGRNITQDDFGLLLDYIEEQLAVESHKLEEAFHL